MPYSNAGIHVFGFNGEYFYYLIILEVLMFVEICTATV